MNRDHHDALIEQLLRESMGGDRPRDLTQRVLALARAHDRSRRAWWISAGASMAAGFILAITIWTLWPKKYPTPVFSEGIVNLTGDPLFERGADLLSEMDRASTFQLGGYIRATVAPNTSFRVGGVPRREVVYLSQGRIDFDVTKKRGTFDVRVGPATVQVTGTSFTVETFVAPYGIREFENRMRVSVKEGSVNVSVSGATTSIAAGDPPQEFVVPMVPLRAMEVLATDLAVAVEDGADNAASADASALVATGSATQSALNTPGMDAGPLIGRAGRGPLAPARAQHDPKLAELAMIVDLNRVVVPGTLQQVGPAYVIVTDIGRPILLGPVGTLQPKLAARGIEPGPQSRVRVVFERGIPRQITRVPRK
jgi:hypothetical protein